MSAVKNVLFLCTDNAVRSIMAEAIMNDISMSKGQFQGYSAGSQPTGCVDPMAIDELGNRHLSANGLRSKSWEEFTDTNAPLLDFVISVCDETVDEICPVWPGEPLTAHWHISDPSIAEGGEFEKQRAFVETFRQLRNRIELMTNLPWEKLDKETLQKHINDIGNNH